MSSHVFALLGSPVPHVLLIESLFSQPKEEERLNATHYMYSSTHSARHEISVKYFSTVVSVLFVT